jgi:ABC-type glycerol-3-phosphate transport system substrate-binding protein
MIHSGGLRGSRLALALLLIAAIVAMTAGCGGPKSDVPVFMMSKGGWPVDVGPKLEASLRDKVGASPTLEVAISPIYSMEKLFVEIAAGGNGVIVVPAEDYRNFGAQGGYVALEDQFDASQYPDGMLNPTDDDGQPMGSHLYGIPLDDSKWLADLGVKGKGLIAFVPVTAKHPDLAVQVLKTMAAK